MAYATNTGTFTPTSILTTVTRVGQNATSTSTPDTMASHTSTNTPEAKRQYPQDEASTHASP